MEWIYIAPYAALGLLISLLLDVYSSGIQPSEFRLKKWWLDNAFRLILSILLLIVALLFSEEIIGAGLSPLTALYAGLGNDALINTFVRRKSVNSFKKPINEKRRPTE